METRSGAGGVGALDDESLNLAKAEAEVLRLAVEALALVLCDDNNRTRLLHTASNDEGTPGGGLMLVVRVITLRGISRSTLQLCLDMLWRLVYGRADIIEVRVHRVIILFSVWRDSHLH